jgi:hypothetical protein
MRYYYLSLPGFFTAILLVINLSAAFGQGLVISEIFANPAGTDSAKETVELLVTQNIDFSVTPYSVVFTNNGTATVNGWRNGGTISYGFNITAGVVTAGQVVYVGGSQMAVSGVILRAINTVTTPGDGFGSAAVGGVLGNGGGSCDGVAVFNVPVAAITSTTVPVDAIFFGTGTGSSVVNGGLDGYQLPANDKYSGGKLQSNSFVAPDPSSGAYITANGTFNPVTQQWTAARTFTLTTVYTPTSGITLASSAPPSSVSFATTHQTVQESVGNATFQIAVANAHPGGSSINIEAVFGTATSGGTDYSFATTTLNIPPGGNGNYPVTVQITDDNLPEASEYVFFRLAGGVSANVTGTNQHTLYIADNDMPSPVASNSLALNLLGSYSNSTGGSNSAEIVAFDPASQNLYIANSVGAKLDIVRFFNPSAPSPLVSVSMTPYGNINSVDVFNGLVAVAIEDVNPQNPGKVVFFDSAGQYIHQVTVGALPDMVKFNHSGTKVYTCNEGEPNSAYTVDPEGSISVINLAGGVLNATVSTITFTQFNGQEAALRSQGIRIFGPQATAAQDFEPEYLTISADDATAWVTLQENNAVAKLNLTANTVEQLFPLGFKDHTQVQNAMDVSDQTGDINIANWPVKGMSLPDAIEVFSLNGNSFIVTANEGDARDYNGFSEETSINAMNLDPVAFPDASFIKNNFAAGRLKATRTLGDLDNDGDFDEIYSFGGRSFSIRNATTGALVYDSGSDMERITASHPIFAPLFNASNGGSTTRKNRSDDKGPEPEGVAVTTFNGIPYAFVALERIGGVMAFDLSNPASPQFVTYANNRSLATNGPDRGAEDLIFIPAGDSPTGQDLLILANEVSSTLTIYAVCPAGGALSTWYADADGDGYGNPAIATQACSQPAGFVANNTDCNDANANAFPGAAEVCDNLDNDCDGQVDEGLTYLTYTGNVVFGAQSQVNAWNPCYTVITGNLIIKNQAITNISKLVNLRRVNGYVSIENTALKDLSGLANLDTVGGNFTVKNNSSQMTSLDGIGNLSRVGGNLSVFSNFKLTDCCDIRALINTPGGVGLGIYIYNNLTGCESVPAINTACPSSQPIVFPDVEHGFAVGADPDDVQNLTIYPNPAEGHVNVRLSQTIASGNMQLFDLQGRLMHSMELDEGTNYASLSLKNIPAGVYFLRLMADGAFFSKKLTVR